MRFKDYIVNTAIKVNYNNIFKNDNAKNNPIEKVFTSASNKLGYKILDETSKIVTYPCTNSVWKQWLSRYAYGDKRFLEYDQKLRMSIYFSENGILYQGVNASRHELLSPIEFFELYDRYKEFLDFVKKYFENTKTDVKQFLLIGFDKNKKYYICSDGNSYYKETAYNDYVLCNEQDNKKAGKYLVDLG